jgi:hypothetical protein
MKTKLQGLAQILKSGGLKVREAKVKIKLKADSRSTKRETKRR